MNKYLYIFFCWSFFYQHGSSQNITHRDFNLYIQSISGLMSSEFIDRQWFLINKDSITKAESDFITIRNIENDSDTQLANIYFAFASFHLFILKNKDISCRLSQLGVEVTPHTGLIPPIYYSHLKDGCSSLPPPSTLHSSGIEGSSNRIFAQLLCEKINIYCDKFTYVNFQIQENPSIQQHPNLQILEQNLSEINTNIRREIQRYHSLHQDFDDIFFRNTMDNKIERNLFSLTINRINQQRGVEFYLLILIPSNYNEEERETLIRKVFECFANTLNTFSHRFTINKFAQFTSAKIHGNNLDIGIAAEHSSTLTKQGIFNIDFINTSINSDFSQLNSAYSIELKASEFFSYYFEDMSKRIQQLELHREKIENQLKQY